MKKWMCIVAAAMPALVSYSATFDFKPSDNTATPYDWNTPSLWYTNSVVANVLPSQGDNVWLTSKYLRDTAPVFIYAGTDAKVSRLYLANKAVNLNPVQLTIDGGSLTTSAESYLGQKSSGFLKLQNGGTFTANARLWIGTANTATSGATTFPCTVLVDDSTSSFNVVNANFYMGNQHGGSALLENHGTVQFSGTATCHIYMGYCEANRSLGDIVSVIDNYGTINATDAYHLYFVGGTSGQTAIITNHVGALIDGAYVLAVGSGSNSVGRLVNEGTIDVNRFGIGGNTYYAETGNTDPDAYADGYVTNSGVISATGIFRVGWQTNCVGRIDNTGVITGKNECIMGYYPGSMGRFRHSDGNLVFINDERTFMVGYQGNGYLELAGETKTVIDKPKMYIAQNGNNSSGKFHSSGELVITNSASLSRGGEDLNAAISKYATARIALYDDAVLSDIGLLRFGNVKTDNSFEVYGNAVVSNVQELVFNQGSSSDDVEGTTTLKVTDNAYVGGFTNIAIVAGAYGRTVIEVADNAFFGLCDDAWSPDASPELNNIEVAVDSGRHGDATIRLRGGRLGLGIRGGLFLGDNENVNVDGCPAKLIGYGCATNQGDSARGYWSRIHLRAGSVTADGEGEERDLDLKTFARVSGTVGEGRSNLNCSGTNGWYAINKGRLLYPARESNANQRFVGDYARLADSYVPQFVNSMKILIKDSAGEEIATNHHAFVELYAPDRTDIPEGLVNDEKRSRRLGIWHGGISKNYPDMYESGIRDFYTADTTIRYDQWRLAELKDEDGEYPIGLEIRLYWHDGTSSGKWKCVSGYAVGDAESNEYRITGTFSQADGVYNLGWFAVVAACNDGTMVIIR